MAAVTPSTDLYLLQCPIEIDNKNQINFSNATTQYNYFSNLYRIGAENFSYQRKDSTIRYPAHIDTIRHFNYCMYRNDNYSNKWFYAFIEDMEYLNDSTTLIKIKTDVYQTWQFDLTFKRCFVKREHVNDDSVGANTVPEGLEYGEYIIDSKQSTSFSTKNCYLAVQVTQLRAEMFSTLGRESRVYNGLPQGCWVLVLEIGDYNNFNNFVRAYDDKNLADAIVSIGLIPKAMVGNPIIYSFDTSPYGFDAGAIPASNNAVTLETITWSRPNKLDTYYPTNNKLFVAPYSYLMMTNNAGSTVSYDWADFPAAGATFVARGAISQGCDIKLTPSNYKTTDLNGGYQWSVTLGKLPMISWNSNFYLNWAAVNSKYVEVQAGLAGANWATNMLSGMMSGNISQMFGSTTSLASDVASIQQQVREARMVPDSARGNQNTGDLNWSLGKSCFTGYRMCIKPEYARCLDEYFSAFGYKVNRNKVPNITGRRNWNYIETVNCNIVANIPQEDLDEIKNMFNSGVTIWHNTQTFMDYSQNNSIV